MLPFPPRTPDSQSGRQTSNSAFSVPSIAYSNLNISSSDGNPVYATDSSQTPSRHSYNTRPGVGGPTDVVRPNPSQLSRTRSLNSAGISLPLSNDPVIAVSRLAPHTDDMSIPHAGYISSKLNSTATDTRCSYYQGTAPVPQYSGSHVYQGGSTVQSPGS